MNKERYNQFISNPSWFERFTWTGLFNNERRPDLNVINFLKEVKPFENININDVNKFWSLLNKTGEEYSKWCKNIDVVLSDEKLYALKLFFIGCIGEYFFVTLFEKHNTLYINKKLYTFNYVCPRLCGESDYGVDLTGIVSPYSDKSIECALQVKFWNPYNNDAQMTYDILSRVYTDAIVNDFINKEETENVFVCWLNDDKQVSKALKNSPIWKNIVFIDKKVLNNNINEKIPAFWDMLFEKLNNI